MHRHPSFMKNQRRIIIELLNKLELENLDLSDLLSEDYGLNNQEFGFVKTIVYGTIRYKITLDYIIKKSSKIKFSKIHKNIKNILRISLYQLIYMDHIPDRAVVNEGVELAKIYGNKGSTSFVNGMLRNFIRNKTKLLDFENLNKYDMLSIKYSFPVWLVKEIEDSYSNYNIENILSEFNEESLFGIRSNSKQITNKELINKLNNKNYKTVKMKNSNNGIIVENPQNIFSSDIYNEGLFYVQSESSQLVSETIKKYIDPEYVLDMCSAPGGKLTHIYEISSNIKSIVGLDISDDKIQLIKENINRLKHFDIKTNVQDGTIFNKEYNDKFDLIILDSPCSALGLIKKYPNIKYEKSLEDIKNLSIIQEKLLENASKYVKNNGIISYSTCSFTKKENEIIINNFLEKNKNFKLLEFLKISPTDFNSDGFSIGIIQRND